MFKLRHLPQYLLAALLIILIALQSWTFYLGTSDVTFKRLIGKEPYKEIKDLSLRRYKEGVISPHLFTITTDDENALLEHLSRDCHLQKIGLDALPKEAKETDSEMVEVIEKSPFIYLSKSYDLQHPQDGRMCLVFRDKAHLYLFINGNL